MPFIGQAIDGLLQLSRFSIQPNNMGSFMRRMEGCGGSDARGGTSDG
jgi:hypothetical protein